MRCVCWFHLYVGLFFCVHRTDLLSLAICNWFLQFVLMISQCPSLGEECWAITNMINYAPFLVCMFQVRSCNSMVVVGLSVIFGFWCVFYFVIDQAVCFLVWIISHFVMLVPLRYDGMGFCSFLKAVWWLFSTYIHDILIVVSLTTNHISLFLYLALRQGVHVSFQMNMFLL